MAEAVTDLTLVEVANNLEHAAKRLKHLYESQLRIDPDWTTLELEAKDAKSLIGGLDELAAIIRRESEGHDVTRERDVTSPL